MQSARQLEPSWSLGSSFAPASAGYRPRTPDATVLHKVVRENLEEFLRQARGGSEDGEGVPDFVVDELRRFLACGSLSGGFARLKCETCGKERLVPFSCKRRAACPSCAGRRMAGLAAHLVDSVFPLVPVRQWVLSVPFALRYRLAWDHELSLKVLRIFWRALDRYQRKRAKERGLVNARTGAVTVIQRAGGALNLNVHFHMAAIDGVFVEAGGELVFHRLPAPSTEDVAAIVKSVRKGVLRLLGRSRISNGDSEDDGWKDPFVEESPALAAASGASVQGISAFGPRTGQRVRRIGEEPDETGKAPKRKRHARYQGFDLDAGEPAKPEERDRVERMLRYLLRPPIAESRLRELPDGDILLTQKTKWSDGTTALVFHPLELLERLAAIIPRPQINLLIYHGVLAPNSHWRKRVVAYGRQEAETELDSKPGDAVHPRPDASDPSYLSDPSPFRPRNYTWAELMRRTFGYDVMACLECGGRMRLIAMIEEPAVIAKILSHLGLPTEPPVAKPARAPPEQLELPELAEPGLDEPIDEPAFDC
ncbi:MAG: transposase [Proteobacteria bacterium]|nr:transposase [Pseudomonadota bacterium]